MELNNEQIDEFKRVVQPLINWLEDNCDPHTIIIVRDDRAELYGGLVGMPKGKRK